LAERDIGALVSNADAEPWTEVVVMAAGQASAADRTQLLESMLDRGREPNLDRNDRDRLLLVALAALESSPERPAHAADEIRKETAATLPPSTSEAADALARGGKLALDILSKATPTTLGEVVATIRVVTRIADPVGLPLLTPFGADPRPRVVSALLDGWQHFEPDEYARSVLAESPLANGTLSLSDRAALGSLRHLRHLTELCVDTEPVDLFFMRDLPDLRVLEVGEVTDFRGLADRRLDLLRLRSTRGSVAVTHLSGMAELVELETHTRIHDLESLDRIPGLRRLLVTAYDTDQFGRWFPRLAGLEALTVRDLSANSRVPALASKLPDVTRLELAGAIPRLNWIGSLSRLRSLDLTLDEVTDLTPLASLRHLERLRIAVDRPGLDLRPLRTGLPANVEIHLVFDWPGLIDLAELAGADNVTVQVDHSATVRGAEQLGPRSTVTRPWPSNRP
jgi:hypothetical protein